VLLEVDASACLPISAERAEKGRVDLCGENVVPHHENRLGVSKDILGLTSVLFSLSLSLLYIFVSDLSTSSLFSPRAFVFFLLFLFGMGKGAVLLSLALMAFVLCCYVFLVLLQVYLIVIWTIGM